MAGKTGTAQVVRLQEGVDSKDLAPQLRHHAWFAAWAPLDRPELVVAVIVEHGGDGGSTRGSDCRQGRRGIPPPAHQPGVEAPPPPSESTRIRRVGIESAMEHRVDPWLILAVVGIFGASLTTLHTVSRVIGTNLLLRQLLWGVAGLITLWLLSRVRLDVFERLAPLLYGVGLIALVACCSSVSLAAATEHGSPSVL